MLFIYIYITYNNNNIVYTDYTKIQGGYHAGTVDTPLVFLYFCMDFFSSLFCAPLSVFFHTSPLYKLCINFVFCFHYGLSLKLTSVFLPITANVTLKKSIVKRWNMDDFFTVFRDIFNVKNLVISWNKYHLYFRIVLSNKTTECAKAFTRCVHVWCWKTR